MWPPFLVRPVPAEMPALNPDLVTVTVEDTNGVLKEGLPVYVFDGSSYTGYSGTSDVNGAVDFDLPDGSYRFRADYNGTQFWSGEVIHCSIPGYDAARVEVTLPVLVTVVGADAVPQERLPVNVFNGATYTGFSDTINPYHPRGASMDLALSRSIPNIAYHVNGMYQISP